MPRILAFAEKPLMAPERADAGYRLMYWAARNAPELPNKMERANVLFNSYSIYRMLQLFC
jgi:hypothetical protein